MSNNQGTQNRTPIELAMEALTDAINRASVNRGGPFDVSSGIPIASMGSSIASFRPLDGTPLVTLNKVTWSVGYLSFLNQISINPSPNGLYNIVNDADAILYVAPDIGSSDAVVRSPAIIIPPYSAATTAMTVQQFMSIVSYIPRFDTRTLRAFVFSAQQNADTEALQNQRVSIYYGITGSVGVITPIKRKFTREYDGNDFETDFGSAPVTLSVATPTYTSPMMNFDGFQDITLVIAVNTLNATNVIANLIINNNATNGNNGLVVGTATITSVSTTVISATGNARGRIWSIVLTATTPTGNTQVGLRVAGVS